MVIEKVFGLQGTGVSLNERFTHFTEQAAQVQAQQMRSFKIIQQARLRIKKLQSINEKVAEKMNSISHKQASNILTNNMSLRNNRYRAMSRGKLSPIGFHKRLWRRGAVGIGMRQRYSNGTPAFTNNGITQRRQVARRSRPFLGQRGRGRRNYATRQQVNQPERKQLARRGRPFVRGRGIGRGLTRRLVSKEQLDQELEQYMSSTPAALDKQLDDYMAEGGIQLDIVV